MNIHNIHKYLYLMFLNKKKGYFLLSAASFSKCDPYPGSALIKFYKTGKTDRGISDPFFRYRWSHHHAPCNTIV